MKDILDALTFLKGKVEKLPTNDEVRAIVREEVDSLVPGIVSVQVRDIHEDVKHIGKRLDTLNEKTVSDDGYAKEIDGLMSRMRRVERHVGISPAAAQL